MKTTRQRIIEYLQHRQPAAPVDISRALQLTAADIRHHLSALEAEEIVEIISQRPAVGRGRPTALYRLKSQAFLNNLAGLSDALLKELHGSSPEAEQAPLNKRLALSMAGEGYHPARNPSQRYLEAVRQLNKMNYQARWEARAEAPQVIITHCPYAALLPGHPELCRIDAELLGILLASPVKQIGSKQLNPQGITQCIFCQSSF